MKKAEILERREDNVRRGEELDIARSSMHNSGVVDLLTFIAENSGSRCKVKPGNFKDWPSVSIIEPQGIKRGELNGTATRFVFQRSVELSFTDVGVSTTVVIKRSRFQGLKKIKEERNVEVDETQLLEDVDVLEHALNVLEKHVVLDKVNKGEKLAMARAKAKEIKAEKALTAT